MKKDEETERSSREKEEDLLEYIYRQERQDRYMTATEYAMEKDLYGKEAAALVRNLIKKGYLKESSRKDVILLTEKGCLKGMECLLRHEKLTQFFQMISGMSQERAQEDACRLEHYISQEGLDGIDNFLQFGDVYDRTYEGMDLYTWYGEGEFEMKMGLYELERRSPRFLAPEYGKMRHTALLKVEKTGNSFYIAPKKEEDVGYVWYRRLGKWVQVKREAQGYRLPADLFTYMVNAAVPITEAKAIIAFTAYEIEPVTIDCREINIHVW